MRHELDVSPIVPGDVVQAVSELLSGSEQLLEVAGGASADDDVIESRHEDAPAAAL
jgi:hypothetical protein